MRGALDALLLHHVRQLVREQALSIRPFRGIAASAKYHLIARCKRMR